MKKSILCMIISFADRKISLTIGMPEIIINGEKKALDVAPIIREERTFLPLRACTEAIGILVLTNSHFMNYNFY